MRGVSQIMLASAVAIWYILPVCVAVTGSDKARDPDTAEEPVIGIDLGTTYSV